MKKNYVNVGILVLVGLLLAGCDTPPAQEDVIKDTRWELKAEGKLTEFKKIRGGGCTCIKEKNWCHVDYYLLIDDTKQFIAGNMIHSEFIKVGSIGKLYKFETFKRDAKSWFQWIMNESPSVGIEGASTPGEKPPKIVERLIPHEIVQIIEVPKLYEWQYYSKYDGPEPYKVVLIKWNDIIATGHLNERGEWKLEVNNGKTLGGPTVDIREWRELEL